MNYPNYKLIQDLRLKYSGYGIKTMTQTEVLDLINHTNEAWKDEEKKAATLRADNAKLREALDVMVYTVDGLVPDKSRTVKDAIAIARRVLEEANA